MNIKLIVVGKTFDKYLVEGIEDYNKRLKHYVKFEMVVINELKNAKNLSKEQIKDNEGDLILGLLSNSDTVVLLDEAGVQFGSVGFADFIEGYAVRGTKNLIFVVGGAYGFSEKVYGRANAKISLSKMTFSHQMVRLIFVEQLYRAHTILKNEPYHHI